MPCRGSGLTKLKGLSVAFLDGTYNKSAYRSKRPPGDELAGCRDYTEVRRANPISERQGLSAPLLHISLNCRPLQRALWVSANTGHPAPPAVHFMHEWSVR